MAAPSDELAITEGRDRGGIRASDADREQAIDALKAAFVQGRLTKDELGARVDRVYASRTYADLTEVIVDIPTALTGAPSARPPWRATKRAWWFEYAAYLPGIVAIILHPRGPDATARNLIILAAVAYLVFWALGVFIMVVSRHVKPSGGQPSSPQSLREREQVPLSFFEREQVIGALRAAFVQGRLTKDELDTRAARVSAARSRTELAALTADLPHDLTDWLPTTRLARTGACVSIAAAGVLAALLLWQPNNALALLLGLLAAATVLVAPPVTVGLIVDARHQKRGGGQLRLGAASSAGEA
jgi:Domain of unknown function (DUF1707)